MVARNTGISVGGLIPGSVISVFSDAVFHAPWSAWLHRDPAAVAACPLGLKYSVAAPRDNAGAASVALVMSTPELLRRNGSALIAE